MKRHMQIACAFLLSVLSVTSVLAAVDNELAKKWVTRGFLGIDCNAPGLLAADLSKRFSDPDQVRIAWRFLKQCRDSGIAASQEAVAAENYLYIRFVAGLTGDTGFRVLPWSYYALKVAGSATGFLQMMRTNPNNPVSDPDPDVRKWGDMGYDDGINDYESRTGQKASLKTSAAEDAWILLTKWFY